MAKLGVFILSFTMLFQSFNFEVGDMYGIPTFINHVSEHVKSGDNFADFIDLHYGNKTTSHQDKHKEHKDLPFKHQHTDTHVQLLFVLNNLKFDVSVAEIGYITENFSYNEPTSNQYINNFFQPPQK